MNRRSFTTGALCAVGGALAVRAAEIAFDHAVIEPLLETPPTRIYSTPLPWSAFEKKAPARQRAAIDVWRHRCGTLDRDFVDQLAKADPEGRNSAAVFTDRGPEWLWTGGGYRLVDTSHLAGRQVDDLPDPDYGAFTRGRFTTARMAEEPMAATVWGQMDGERFEYVSVLLPMRTSGYDAVLSVGALPHEYGRA